MAISQKIWNQSNPGPSNTTLEHKPKKFSIIPQGHCSTVFIAALFVIVRTNLEWIKKMWYIYSVVKKKIDILKFAYKLMELEKIILSGVTQTQKDEHGMYSLISRY